MTISRLDRAFGDIDAANAADPHVVSVAGRMLPYAVHYGQRMTHWLSRLDPVPAEPLAIAVRGQHIRRFDIPRSEFPMDKPGYFAWRNTLKDHHADLLGAIMARCGYGPEDIARMQGIVRKERLKRDPAAQTLEDCACLVFLENEFTGFIAAKDYDDDKIVTIVAKTWIKMSPAGHALALGLVPSLPERLQGLVVKAVSG